MTSGAAEARDIGPAVLRVSHIGMASLEALLGRSGLKLQRVPRGARIPGSYWGEPEAGLIGDRLYAAPETPIHSILHEAGHYICMDEIRRAGLHTDAGGDELEEAGVCYLQIVLAGLLHGVGADRLMADMDAWGYSFRLGSTRAWFEQDAEDARAWLAEHGIIDGEGRPTWRLRL